MLFYDEMMTKYDGMSRNLYNPEDFKWWAKNIRNIIMVKHKSKPKDHARHPPNCDCTSVVVKVSKSLIEKQIIDDMDNNMGSKHGMYGSYSMSNENTFEEDERRKAQ